MNQTSSFRNFCWPYSQHLSWLRPNGWLLPTAAGFMYSTRLYLSQEWVHHNNLWSLQSLVVPHRHHEIFLFRNDDGIKPNNNNAILHVEFIYKWCQQWILGCSLVGSCHQASWLWPIVQLIVRWWWLWAKEDYKHEEFTDQKKQCK